MAGTGRTQHYDIPIYNAGDTVNDLNTYNNAMEIIDTQLDTVDTLATANQEEFTSLNAQVQKQQGDITKLQEGVVNAQGTANGALAQIQELVNPQLVTFSPMPSSDTSPRALLRNDMVISFPNLVIRSITYPSITFNGNSLYLLGKIDNANPFNMGANNVVGAVGQMLILHNTEGPHAIYTSGQLVVAYDGVNTYLGSYTNLDNILTGTYDYGVWLGGIALYNGQPKNNG